MHVIPGQTNYHAVLTDILLVTDLLVEPFDGQK